MRTKRGLLKTLSTERGRWDGSSQEESEEVASYHSPSRWPSMTRPQVAQYSPPLTSGLHPPRAFASPAVARADRGPFTIRPTITRTVRARFSAPAPLGIVPLPFLSDDPSLDPMENRPDDPEDDEDADPIMSRLSAGRRTPVPWSGRQYSGHRAGGVKGDRGAAPGTRARRFLRCRGRASSLLDRAPGSGTRSRGGGAMMRI